MRRRVWELRLCSARAQVGVAAVLAIGVLLILLAGCSASSSAPPSASKSGPSSQSAPAQKVSPNVPGIVRAQAAEPYTGGARLSIDEASLDYGKVKLEDWVQAAFHVKNVGDAPLTITGDPLVRVVEGC